MFRRVMIDIMVMVKLIDVINRISLSLCSEPEQMHSMIPRGFIYISVPARCLPPLSVNPIMLTLVMTTCEPKITEPDPRSLIPPP